jgi:hypothetical protein
MEGQFQQILHLHGKQSRLEHDMYHRLLPGLPEQLPGLVLKHDCFITRSYRYLVYVSHESSSISLAY